MTTTYICTALDRILYHVSERNDVRESQINSLARHRMYRVPGIPKTGKYIVQLKEVPDQDHPRLGVFLNVREFEREGSAWAYHFRDFWDSEGFIYYRVRIRSFQGSENLPEFSPKVDVIEFSIDPQTCSKVDVLICGAKNACFSDSRNSSGVCLRRVAAWSKFVDHTIEEKLS